MILGKWRPGLAHWPTMRSLLKWLGVESPATFGLVLRNGRFPNPETRVKKLSGLILKILKIKIVSLPKITFFGDLAI